MELQSKHYDTIMDCLDQFDFERVHKVMKYMNWTWSDVNEVPDVSTLRKHSRRLLQEAAKEALTSKSEFIIGTGGFRCEAKLYEDNFLWLRLSFSIEEWDNAE